MESKKKSIKIYSTPTCPYCQMAKEYLAGRKENYEEINVATDPQALAEMMEKSGQRGVPVILINKEVIVGFDQPAIDAALSK